MDKKQKQGLLPKWIYLATVVKILLTIAVLYKAYIIDKQTLRFNYFYIAHFLLITLRLVSIKRICEPRYFLFVTFSFAIDIVTYLFERRFGVSVYRTVFEVLFSIVSILWMVFLYPYYLVDTKKEKVV